MDWWIYLVIFLGGLFFFMALGLPIAFAFFAVNFGFLIYNYGIDAGSSYMISSQYTALVKFSLTPIPLFILMGELIFRSGIVSNALDSLAKWMGKLPGRLSILSLGGGALFSNLSGSAMANTALLGSTLVPEMQKRGYQKNMIFGPIMGAAGLAIVIPPSNLAILLGSIGQIPVGPLLIAGIIPGMIMALFYVIYVVIRCQKNPSLAPIYETQKYTLSDKLISTVKYILPLFFIVGAVLGFIFFGIATPTEAAAIGALSALVLVILYGKLNLRVIRESLMGTLKTTCLVMFIIGGAAAFSQLLSLTGATRHIVGMVSSIEITPIYILLGMLLIVFILGTFLEQVAIMMVVLPFFMPIVIALGFDPIWFGVLMLITMEIGTFSPPFGMILFVMKGVAPKGTTMGDIYKSAIPFILIDILVVIVILLFPFFATWLPQIMYR